MTGVRAPSTVRTAAGTRTVVVVEVTGGGPGSPRHVVRAVGLDPSWAGLPVLTGPLAPGETVEVELPVLVPAGSPAGSFPFVLSVAPDGGRAVEVDAVLVVGDAARLAVTLEPREPTGRRHRRFSVLLENGTTEPVPVALSGEGPRELHLRAPRRPVVVPAGGAARVRMGATVGRRLGGASRRLPFVVVADTPAGPARTDGIFVAPPVFGPGLLKVLAVLAVIAVWAGLSVVAIGSIDRQPPASEIVATGPGQGGEGGADDGGAGSGAGSTGNGGTENVAPGGGRAEARPVASSRLTGVVTGENPGGVTVTLAPTSLPAEADQGSSVGSLRTIAYRPRAATRVPSSQVLYALPRTVSRTLSTTTRADGSWAFAGVTRTGYYLLTFTKAGYQTQRFVLTRDGSAEPPMTTLLQAGRGRASGRVVSEGRPVRGATVTVSDGDTTVTTSTGSTGDDAGRWSVSGLTTPATYVVSASAPGRALASRLVTLGAGRDAGGVDLVLRRGLQTLVGEVRQAGDVRGGVTVTAVSGETTRTATSLSSNSGGALAGGYSLPDLPLGDYVVTWSAEGYTSVTRKASLTGAAPSLRLPDVVLQTAGASLSGVVTDLVDTPVVGAGVALASITNTYKITTADDGTYRFDGIEPGSYVLTVEKLGFQPAVTPVDVAAAVLRRLDLRLRPLAGAQRSGTITGEVADARTTGTVQCPGQTACVTIEVLDAEPPVTPVTSDGARPYVIPGPGSPGLDAGQYRVRISAPGYDSAIVPVAVPLDGVGRAARVALQPRGSLVGTITPAAAAPLPTTCVIVLPSLEEQAPPTPTCTLGAPDAAGEPTCSGGDPSACAVVGPKGEYRVTGLPRPGGYFAYVVPVGPGAEEWIPVPGVSLVLTPGETKRYDADLSRRARLQLLLRAPSPSGGLQAPSQPVEVVLTPLDGTPPPPRATYTSSATSPGELTVPSLEDGAYTVRASGTPLGGTTRYSGRITRLTVGRNQTTRTELVLTPERAGVFVGRVQWGQDGQEVGVAGAQVTVTGTTGYTGTSPVREARVVTTNAAGCYAVTRDGTTAELVDTAAVPAACGTLAPASIATMVLTENGVTVKADATAVATEQGRPVFGTVTDTAEVGAGLVVSTVPVAGVRFDGAVVATPASPVPPFERARVTLTSTAPGAGAVSVSAAASGVLTWKDASASAPDLVRPGTYRLLAQLAGYDDAVGTLTCTRDARGVAAPCRVRLDLAGDVTLTVEVAAADGSAVPGAEVTLTGAGVPTTTASVPGGTREVTFPGLSIARGPYTVTVRAPGFVDRSATTTLEGPDGLRVTLVPERRGAFEGTVTVRIGDTTTPAAGLRVTATGQPVNGPPVAFSAVTGNDGRYRIVGTLERPGLPFDSDTVWTLEAARPDGFTGGRRENVRFSPDAESDERARTVRVDLQVTADGVNLEVTVNDDREPGGVPVLDATVSVRRTDGTGDDVVLEQRGTSHVYAVEGLAPIGYVLTVTAPQRAPLTTVLSLTPGQVQTKVSVLLADRRNSIAVKVLATDPTGPTRPLPGAVLLVRAVTPAPAPSPSGSADPSVPPSDDPSVAPSDDPSVPPSDDPSVAPSDDPSTPPAADCAGPLPPPGGTAVDAAGERQVTGLADGTYDVVVAGPDDSWSCVTRRLVLERGQLASLEVTLSQRLPSVDVRVVSTSDTDMTGAEVSLVATSDGGVSQGPQVAPGGSGAPVRFTQVVPGRYLLTTRGPDLHLASSRAVTVTAVGPSTPDPQPLTATVAEDRVQVRVEGGDERAEVTVSSDAGPVVTTSVGSARRDVFVPRGVPWRVTASAPGSTVTVSPPSGTGSGDVVVRLAPPAGTAEVDVLVTGRGSPPQDAQVTATSDDGSFTGSTDGAGRVALRGLPPGSYRFVATTVDGGYATGTATLAAGSNPDVVLALTRDTGALQVRVVSAPNVPVEGAVVELAGPVARGPLTTDADGRVAFFGLPPGDYTVTAAGGTPPGTGERDVAVVAGGTTRVDVELVVTVAPVVTTAPPASGTATTGP